MSRDLPIQFSPPMVRALLAGKKRQTRRLTDTGDTVRLLCRSCGCSEREWKDGAHDGGECSGKLEWTASKIPRYRVGDRLYVREAWRVSNELDAVTPRDMDPKTRTSFIADQEVPKRLIDIDAMTGKFRQAMHMPRWASRLTLIVNDVSVQRLQDITQADCIAEGPPEICAEPSMVDGGVMVFPDPRKPWARSTPRAWYHELWDQLNGKRAPWSSNPWVAAYTFAVCKGNIDKI